jgi:O-antigen ligase
MATGSIIASGSRGGILGLIVVGFWLVAYKPQRFKTFFILSLAGLVVYMATPPEFKERFETVGEDRTSLSRLMYWEYGIEAIKINPVSGVGFRNWRTWVMNKHPELVGLIGSPERVEVIHNTYLEAATELGLLGLAAYLGIFIQVFRANLHSARTARQLNDRFLSSTASGLNGSLVVYAIPSYFMSVLYYPYIWVILALTVCLSCICRQEATRLDE